MRWLFYHPQSESFSETHSASEASRILVLDCECEDVTEIDEYETKFAEFKTGGEI